MLSVFNVAAYILETKGKMTTMKLQKLVYYCQAWSLAWDNRPLFREPIEAWINGPVVRELFQQTRGTYQISEMNLGDVRKISGRNKRTIDAITEFYGNESPDRLIALTHSENPWKNARKGYEVYELSAKEITRDSMKKYYRELLNDAWLNITEGIPKRNGRDES